MSGTKGSSAFGRESTSGVASSPIGRYALVEGGRVYFETLGRGPLVLLLHSSGMDSYQWRAVLPLLADAGFQGCAFDLPGHGKSDLPPSGPVEDIGSFVASVSEACANLAAPQAIVGCSIGGKIALEMAASAVGRSVSLCVLVGSAAKVPPIPTPADRWSSAITETIRSELHRTVGTAAPSTYAAELSWRYGMCAPEVIWADLMAWNNHDGLPSLCNTTCKVLVVRGSEDPFVPVGSARETVERSPDGELLEMGGVGHYPMVDPSGLCNAIVAAMPDSAGPSSTCDAPGGGR